MTNQALPLAGIRVVSLEQAAAAPLCTRRMALAGAEVIKIERPEGDFARGYDSAVAGTSTYFAWLNGGKKSVVLDLKSAAGQAHLTQLIASCDVLVQNLKPGALAGLGVDLEALHEARADWISVSISGFHPRGPGADRKAYDMLMQAESGLASVTGSPDAPGRVGVSAVDFSTGMYAYEAALEALMVRDRTGQGEALQVALFDAVADWMAVPYLWARYGGQAPARVGLAHPGICPYGVFASADLQEFVLSIQNEREWQRLCAALSLQDLAADARTVSNAARVENRRYVDAKVQAAFGAYNYAELAPLLDQADLAFAPVNSVDQLIHHPDFATISVQVEGQPVLLPVVPGRELNQQRDLPVPMLGQHTDEVLGTLADSTIS